MKYSFNVVSRVGRLNSYAGEANKEINVMQWGDSTYIDIRKWENDFPQKGVSLNLYEAKKLLELLPIAISILDASINNSIELEDDVLGVITDQDIK